METDKRETRSRKVNFPAVVFLGRCPRCDRGQIFGPSFLGLKPHCPSCMLDLEPYQQADGPAFFVILFAGAIMTPIALWLASTFELNRFALITILALLTSVLVIGMLRLAKGILIASQYQTDAREGRLDTQVDPAGSNHD